MTEELKPRLGLSDGEYHLGCGGVWDQRDRCNKCGAAQQPNSDEMERAALASLTERFGVRAAEYQREFDTSAWREELRAIRAAFVAARGSVDEALLSSLIEPITKAVLFDDCGNTVDWEENINIGIAAVGAIRAALLESSNGASTLRPDANLERMGEALYNLSDSLRASGFLDDRNDVHQARYNEVIRAWLGLARVHERLLASCDTRRMAETQNSGSVRSTGGAVPPQAGDARPPSEDPSHEQ